MYNYSRSSTSSSTFHNSSSSLLQHPVSLECRDSWSERDVYFSSSIVDQSFSMSSISINTHPFTHPSNISSCSFLQPPVSLASSSSISKQTSNKFSFYSLKQAQSNPHDRFLNRSEKTCPTHLTEGKRNRWLKVEKRLNSTNN